MFDPIYEIDDDSDIDDTFLTKRIKIDPEDLVSSLCEDFPHTRQRRSGVDEQFNFIRAPQTQKAEKAPKVPKEPKNTYTRLRVIGEGTYGRVFKARNDKNGTIVAVKSITVRTIKSVVSDLLYVSLCVCVYVVTKRIFNGTQIHLKCLFAYLQTDYTVAREVKMLRSLGHENIINLLDYTSNRGSINTELELVFDYCEYDLLRLVKNNKVIFKLADVKNLLYQLFTGLDFIHENNVSAFISVFDRRILYQ